MPWQRHVADVAFEYDPDTMELVYREVVLTVPRQSGKTTLMLAVMVARATRFGPRQNIVYTAQTRQKALQKFRDEHIPILEASIYHRRHLYRERKQNGSEALVWQNGSIHSIDAPMETSGHGDPIALPILDEAWADVDDRREQAFAPAMIAQRNAQRWVASTAGNERSVYFYRKVVDGRESEGLPSSSAYFEWSASPDDDPGDPETWRRCMPALGFTQPESAVRAEYSSARRRPESLSMFRRGFTNVWMEIPPIDLDQPSLIPLEWFDDCVDRKSKMVGRRVLVPDVSRDRTTAAIVAVAKSSRFGTHVEVVDHRPGQGTDWLMGKLKELHAKRPTSIVAAHLGGPVGSYELDLKREFGDKFRAVTDAELRRGCGGVYTAIREGSFKHLGSPALRQAIEGATRSNRGDTWIFVRTSEATDMTTLMAASVGWYVNGLPDQTPPAPATATTSSEQQSQRELWRPSSRLDI